MSSSPSPSFSDLNLSAESLRALDGAGFEHPTPIQAQAIPPALTGKDVIGTAATGTGKTAAFVLPMIERLAGKTGHARARARADARAGAADRRGARALRPRPARARRRVIGGVGMGEQTPALREAARSSSPRRAG